MSNNNQKKDRIVCFCYSIPESEIVEAIQDGAKTLKDIRTITYANTGCGGCGEDVKKLLRKHVPKVEKAAQKAEQENSTDSENQESDQTAIDSSNNEQKKQDNNNG